MRRSFAFGVALLALVESCATAPPPPASPSGAAGAAASDVAVYQAPEDGSHAMPSGCREVRRTAPQAWTEMDRVAPADPYRVERAATATAGGNVLLVLDRMTRPRTDFDCPAAAKITDCPRTMGAWYDLVFVSYDCSTPALSELHAARERRP
jgi:hypothetical protein